MSENPIEMNRCLFMLILCSLTALISGDFKRCRADQLEGFATKEVLESIIDLEPKFLVFNGDASLNKLLMIFVGLKSPV